MRFFHSGSDNTSKSNAITEQAQKPVIKKRDSNLELFRIITMLLIIAHHFVVNSGLKDMDGPIASSPFTFNSLFLLIFGAWARSE